MSVSQRTLFHHSFDAVFAGVGGGEQAAGVNHSPARQAGVDRCDKNSAAKSPEHVSHGCDSERGSRGAHHHVVIVFGCVEQRLTFL